jgi:hypothetical protein
LGKSEGTARLSNLGGLWAGNGTGKGMPIKTMARLSAGF